MLVSSLHIGARWRTRVASYLARLEESHYLLDAGCGEGYATRTFSSLVQSTVGLDLVAHYSCADAVNGDSNLSFVSGNLTTTPFGTGVFSVVVCTDVLEHVTDVPAVLKEMQRVTKAGGRVVLMVPISETHGHFGYTPENFRKLVQELNFEVEYFDLVHYGPITSKLRSVHDLARKILLQRRQTSEVDEWDKTYAFQLKHNTKLMRSEWLVQFISRCLDHVEGLERVPFVAGKGNNLAVVLRV